MGEVTQDAEAASLKLDSPLTPDGDTAHGNDPRLELHYPTELDPARALPDNGYPYLDRVQRMQSEIRRASVEDREPDYDNPGPDASNPYRSTAELSNHLSGHAAALAKAEPAAVLEPEDRGLVESESGALVAAGTVPAKDSVSEDEFGIKRPVGEDAGDPEAVEAHKEREAEREEADNEPPDNKDESQEDAPNQPYNVNKD